MSKPRLRTAAIMPIGNEILSGRTLDTNSHWIAQQLSAHGVRLQEIRVVPDEKIFISGALNELREKYDFVMTTGGIGPTHDDVTAEAVAAAFARDLVTHQDAYDMLLAHYGSKKRLTPGRLKMARVPEGASLIPNQISGAPGFQIQNVYVLAGVPEIMKEMASYVLSAMERGPSYLSEMVSCPFAESQICYFLEKIQEKHSDCEIGSYPYRQGQGFSVNIVVRGQEKKRVEQACHDIRLMLTRLKESGGQ